MVIYLIIDKLNIKIMLKNVLYPYADWLQLTNRKLKAGDDVFITRISERCFFNPQSYKIKLDDIENDEEFWISDNNNSELTSIYHCLIELPISELLKYNNI